MRVFRVPVHEISRTWIAIEAFDNHINQVY